MRLTPAMSGPPIHGDGQRFAPEVGQEAPIAEQIARLRFVAPRLALDGAAVLDCGSGTGYSLDFLATAAPAARYVGIDQEPAAVGYARARYPTLAFLAMDGLRLGFASASFDVVLSFEVLEHLRRDQQVTYLDEIRRVLKPGGTLVLSTPNRDVFSLGHRDSLNKYHLAELALPELEALLAPRFGTVETHGQYFRSEELRARDAAFLRRTYSPGKRVRLALGRVMRGHRLFGRPWRALEALRERGVHGPRVYPWAIDAGDFAFDRAHCHVAKWFLCLCTT
jgi:SAM-dependent methyltransferase